MIGIDAAKVEEQPAVHRSVERGDGGMERGYGVWSQHGLESTVAGIEGKGGVGDLLALRARSL